MKIMYVINSFGSGGAERHLLALVRHLVRSGHTVVVVALTGIVTGGAKNIAEDFIRVGAGIAALDAEGGPWLRDVGRWLGLYRLARSWAPEILHSHLPRADLAASIVKRLLPDTVWITTVHDAYIKGVYSGYWVFRWLYWNWRVADHVIAVSGHAKRWAIEALRVPDLRISKIYHGISLLPANCQTREGVGDGHQFKIGCLARFEPRKGVATLIKAMVTVCVQYPNARLLVAGSDHFGYAQEMRQLANRLGVSHAVDIQGFCDTPFDFMGRLDIFAFASTSEGFGIVLLEAMAVGVPIVTSDIYPLNHIVVGGETGVLATPGNPDSFASALIQLIENPGLARRMGEAGRRRCFQEFSEEKMLKLTEDLYFRSTAWAQQ